MKAVHSSVWGWDQFCVDVVRKKGIKGGKGGAITEEEEVILKVELGIPETSLPFGSFVQEGHC